MGMDYRYAGSASYPRFDEELCKVAKVLGGIETEHLKERRDTENDRPLGHWFGFLSSDHSDKTKFVFPDGTNETLVRWFNNVYDYFTAEETRVVWSCISEHPEIEDISDQIWYELYMLNKFNEGWSIY